MPGLRPTTRGWPATKSHSSYRVRPLKIRRLFSLLVLATPMIAPKLVPVPTPGPEEPGLGEGVGLGLAPGDPPGAGLEGATISPCRISRHFPSFENGSLNSLRRNVP